MTQLTGTAYTNDMDLRLVVEAYKHRHGYTPGWVVGTRAHTDMVDSDTRRWLREHGVTLGSHEAAGAYWWAGQGRLP